MQKDIDMLSEEIDELLLHKLELMEEKIRENIRMETFLRDGHIQLAKAKYICGKENISTLQIPSNKNVLTSLFDLETKIANENDDVTPRFDISLKEANKFDGTGDPIKWFGILVPQNLRNSQKCFQEAVYHTAKIANIQAELSSVLSKLSILYVQKDNIYRSNSIKT